MALRSLSRSGMAGMMQARSLIKLFLAERVKREREDDAA
jgi:hypothetical protein